MNKQTAPSYDGRFYSLRAQPVMHHQEMEEDDDDDCVAAANGRAHTHTRTPQQNWEEKPATGNENFEHCEVRSSTDSKLCEF